MGTLTRNCGPYKYKSFIGEGPKHTFSQKFNLDGTLDGKRHPKAHIIEPTPGPGSYNIKSDLGGPKYTIGLKRVKKSLSQSDMVPGVGSYQLRKDKSFMVPSFKFDSEKRDNLEVNKSTINFPGPGKYKEVNSLETKGIIWTFTKQGRFRKIKNKNPKLVTIKIPGPGSYNIQGIFGNEGAKYTFNKEKFNHSDGVEEGMKEKISKYPSPVTYNKKIDYVSDMPRYTIPKFDKSKYQLKSTSPGPCHYTPNVEFSSIFKKITNCIMNKSHRDESVIKNPNVKRLNVPGPGHYDFKNGEFPQGPKYTIRKIDKEAKIIEQPGPGNYEAKDNHRNKEPSYSIGKELRDDNLKRIKKDDYPGPGAYNTKEMNTSPKYTFPKDTLGKGKNLDVPGPGFYKSPTAFDYINDMARNNGSFDPNFRYV